MKEIVITILKLFSFITTGIIFCVVTFIYFVDKSQELNTVILWQILIMAFVCAMGDVMFISRKEVSKRQGMLRSSIYFFIIL